MLVESYTLNVRLWLRVTRPDTTERWSKSSKSGSIGNVSCSSEQMDVEASPGMSVFLSLWDERSATGSFFGEQKEAEGNMHPHDQAIEDFHALKPHLFTSFVRIDLRQHYSFDIFEQEALLQLWFRADDVQEAKKPFLHLSCYGVERRKDFSLLWPCYNLPFQLKMKAIRQHYLQGLSFELSYLDEDYDDYSPLFACRRFEAQLEETFE